MYKLLPEQARAKVKNEYLLRRAVVMVAAFILVEVVAMGGLFPSYILSQARQKEVSDKNVVVKEEEKADEEVFTWLDDVNTQLKALSPKIDIDRPSENILAVIREKGTGVKLTGFTWIKSDGQTRLVVSGLAQSRQALLSFEDRLKESGRFTEVTLPVSNLAKDSNINFEVKLTIPKPQ
jgi:hypothetical protein